MDAEHEELPVWRCVCYDTPFAELKSSGLGTLDEIRERFGCTSGCGMCAKYIELMLETGDTAFPILWGPEFVAYRRRRR